MTKISEKLETTWESLLNGNIAIETIEKAKKEIIAEEKQKKENSFLLTVRLRDLRRSFNTKLANLGIDSDIRQRILGHKTAQTNSDYTAANLETALNLRKKLESQTIIEADGSH